MFQEIFGFSCEEYGFSSCSTDSTTCQNKHRRDYTMGTRQSGEACCKEFQGLGPWKMLNAFAGVAYSKHIVHMYSYHGGDDVRNHLEIKAHGGSVNDLAFSYPNKQLSIVTCGDDRAIKVWDAVTGIKQYTFEGHEAPVHSVCTHHKENIRDSQGIIQLSGLCWILPSSATSDTRLVSC